MNEGWIKLHRCLFEKAIWQNSTPEHKTILITLLGMANHSGREWEWKGKQFKAEPGMLVTSLESICNKCGKGISIQNVRSALKKFENYEFLTQEVTKTGRLITIVNWGLYQVGKDEGNKQTNKEVTNDQQSTNKEPTKSQQRANKEVTTNKNDKNIKNNNNDKEYEEGKEIYTTQLPLSFPTPIHELIFNQFGDVTYKTWFIDSTIETIDQCVTITVKEKFRQQVIQDRFLDAIKMLTNKEVVIKEGK
ncbi:hypothetical protein [Clostridium taeniosporum]|uniref:DNA replication protein DnaD n=1 Tax=Clostridium taeniosporum TaxID=394958 RepID=A0A1D7XLT4_9CLOT|nr:hypothetical protein [Clostridium taeniosporum]AOR24323.1 DNA replication protein DnaD [Clostridium taeniosporum]